MYKIDGVFSFVVVQNHKSWETNLVTKLWLCYKKQTHPLKRIFLTKQKHYIHIFGYALKVMFFGCCFFQEKNSSRGCFGFYNKG